MQEGKPQGAHGGKSLSPTKPAAMAVPPCQNRTVKPWGLHSGLSPVPDLEDVSSWKQGEKARKVHLESRLSGYTVYLGRLERLSLFRGHSCPAVLVEGLQLSLETKLLG